jgi:CubicO group peptidase (beta-lactamase class C family)
MWSVSKAILNAAVGVMVGDGRLRLTEPLGDMAWWPAANDPRRAITVEHLLRMTSGLAFAEDYAGQASDSDEMLFGPAGCDTAGFAACKPLVAEPGTVWSYSSGTTNILSAVVRERTGGDSASYLQFLRKRVFVPLNMSSALPVFDASGTFVASSFLYCAPREMARFAMLYLKDGVWGGRRLLPEGWVSYTRTATATVSGEETAYGAHFWLDRVLPGSLDALGFGGQVVSIIPDLDLVLLRFGFSPNRSAQELLSPLREVAELFGDERYC